MISRDWGRRSSPACPAARRSSSRSVRSDAEALEIQLHGCPLKDAWREAGLAEEKVATLCRIAGAVDKGLFEGAGFKFENRTWTPGAKGCCFLSVRRG